MSLVIVLGDMRRLFKTISRIGITHHQALSQQNKILLLNQITTIVSLAIWFKFFNDIYDNDWIGMLINAVIGTLLGCTFLLNYLQKIDLARAWFISIFLIGITAVNLLLGKELGAEFGFFTCVIMTIIFFETTSARFIYCSLTILCYVASQIYFQNFDSPLAHILKSSSYHFLFFANLICTILSVLTFAKENKNFSFQTIKLLESTKEQNEKLAEVQLQLKQQNEKLEGANMELEKFAYIASHDLKSPLRNIINFSGLIQKKCFDQLSEDGQKYFNVINKNANHMHCLIEDILEYSRLNGEDFSLNEINLNELLPKVLENIEANIQEKNGLVQFNNLPIIRGHESQLILVFQNFIENAIKYNRNKRPTVFISSETNEEAHIIYIKDNGIGISQEHYDRIFEMFSRLHNQREFQGSGIGLAICQKIVKYHGGKIELESEPGEGTTFAISFPLFNAIPQFSIDNPAIENLVST